MQIPPIPQAGQDYNLIVSPRNALALQMGEIVQAEVLTVTDTAVAIRMKNTILEARTNLPLKEGEFLSLKVEGWEKEVRLRLLPREQSDVASLKSTILSALAMLKGTSPAARDLQLLSSFIKNAPAGLQGMFPSLQALEKLLPSLEELSGSGLKNAVQDSGVFFETKLRLMVLKEGQDGQPSPEKVGALVKNDLKTVLMNLQDDLNKPLIADSLLRSGVRPDSLMAAVDNLLKNMEVFQLQSRLNNTIQVFIPFVWQDLRQGELIFRESEQEREGERAYSCTLNLDLERVGRLSALAVLQAGRIHVNVLAESERFTLLLRGGAELLRKQFETAGLNLGNLTIQQKGVVDFSSSRAGGLNIRV